MGGSALGGREAPWAFRGSLRTHGWLSSNHADPPNFQSAWFCKPGWDLEIEYTEERSLPGLLGQVGPLKGREVKRPNTSSLFLFKQEEEGVKQ